MTVSTRSRYLAAPQVMVDANSDALPNRGNNLTIYTPSPVFDHVQYGRYVTRQGDTFFTIAFDQWGDPFLWWRLADANPQIFYPEDLTAGMTIRIPRAA